MKKQSKLRKIGLGLLTATVLLGGYITIVKPATALVAQEVSRKPIEETETTEATLGEKTEEATVGSENSEGNESSKEALPIQDPRTLLAPTGRAGNATTIAARGAELVADGWVAMTKNESFEVPIPDDPNGGKLRYFFGPYAMVAPGNSLGNFPINPNYVDIRIPNVQYVLGGIMLDHLFQVGSVPTAASIATTAGLIVANPQGQSYLQLAPTTVKIYKKTSEGLTTIKLVGEDNYGAHSNQTYKPSLLVETTMTPLKIGKVNIQQTVTNRSSETYSNFMLGYSEDTQLAKEDNVPIYHIGSNRGVYIQTSTKTYRLTYLLSNKDLGSGAPDNWTGYKWIGSQSNLTYPASRFFLSDRTKFRNIYSTGFETNNTAAGTKVVNAELGGKDSVVNGADEKAEFDSGIHMKNQPVTLGPAESTGFNWSMGLDAISLAPKVSFLKDEQTVEPNFSTYELEGEWSDEASATVDLYYKINGGTEVKLSNLPNAVTGLPNAFKIPLTRAQLNSGDNKIEVYAVNQTDKRSNTATTTVKVKSQFNINYVHSVTGAAITPPASAPKTQTGLVGSAFTMAIPTITGYTYDKVTGNVTKSGNNLNGTFTAANQTITLAYKPISTTGKVTFTYKDIAGNIITPPAGVNAPLDDVQTIGDMIKYYTPNFAPNYEIESIGGDATWITADKSEFRVLFAEKDKNVILTYKKMGKANIKYVDEARNPITPPAGSPTELWGALATSKNQAVPSLSPLYEISSVEGAALSGDKSTYLISSFTDADQTVTLVYKAIPQEVTMTVKYLMTGTTNGVIDLTSNDAVKEVKKTVTIGQPISGYSDSFKKDIDGYNYKSVTGNTGNVLDKDFEVIYFYEGILSLENVPDKVDFQNANSLISFGTKDIYPKTPIQVGILDTRDSSSQSWELQLSVATPMQTASSQMLKGDLKINQGGNDITLSSTKQVVRKQGTKNLGRENLTWGAASDKGLYLEQQPGNLKDVTYEGKLSWQLTDGL